MSKKLIMIGLVLISVTALSASDATAWLGGWGGSPGWSMNGAQTAHGLNFNRGKEVVLVTMDLDIEVICDNKEGKIKPGYAFLPHVSLFSQLDPTAYYRKGGACAEFYIPFSYTTGDWEVCQSSNNPHNWWRPAGDHTALVWSYITRNEEFKCSGEELDGKQFSEIPKVDDDPCWENCEVDENGELQYDDDGNCIGTYDVNDNPTSFYFTLGKKQDEKIYECTLPLVDDNGDPIEYRDPNNNYDVILPPPSNYYCCELDVDNNYAVIEETCGFWPADCTE